MYLIYLVIFWLIFKASSCQLQCVKETFDDREFFLSTIEHLTVEAEECIRIPYELSLPTNKVTAPYKKIWFEEHSQKNVSVIVVHNVDSQIKDALRIDGLPRGEYEYRFKLEWGCNQIYIFPRGIRISVSALTQKPIIMVPFMKEGVPADLSCYAHHMCVGRANVHWKWDDQQIAEKSDYYDNYKIREKYRYRERIAYNLIPTAQDHNKNITCVAEYKYSVVETTVTLSVKFPPKILKSSQCKVKGKLLVCECISWGNPLAPITWPWASLTDYSVSSTSNIQTVNSTITMPAADYHNTTVKCICINELGKAEIEIPLQNYTDSYILDWRQRFDASYPWITALSFSLNLILLTSLIVCTYKWRKRMRKKLCEEKTYASLNMAKVEQEYSIISPQPM